MASAFRATLIIAGEVAVVAVFGVSALGKFVNPLPALEAAEATTGSPWIAAVAVSVGTALECGLALGVCLRLFRGQRAIGLGVCLMLLLTAWLGLMWHTIGGSADCGCFSVVRQSSVRGSMLVNAIFVGELVTVLVAVRVLRGPPRAAERAE